MSNTQKTPDDYIKDALNRYAQARAEGAPGEALVWLGTAAILDSDTDRADPCSPVNTALFQMAYDAACDSERRVLKCGNVTTRSGELLSYSADAADILLTRLDDNAPEAARSVAIVLKGHFDALFRRFARHYDPQLAMRLTLTSGADAKFCLDTCRAVRDLIAGVDGLDVKTAQDPLQRQYLLHICVTSPRYEASARFWTFLNAWDKALFYIEGAQYLLDEIKASPAMQSDTKVKAVADLTTALASARAIALAQDTSKAKQAFRNMADKCNVLIGDQRHMHMSLDF